MLLSKFLFLLLLTAPSLASVELPGVLTVKGEMARTLQLKYPSARIEMTQGLERVDAGFLAAVQNVELLQEEPGFGIFRLDAQNSNGDLQSKDIRVGFLAHVKALAPKIRVLPRQALSPELFEVIEVNIASGVGRQYRGVLLSEETPLKGLESIQTLLEGQFVLSTAVQKIPDVRPGMSVEIRVRSGALLLSTSGIAQETASVGSPVRVTTSSTKKELNGKLVDSKIVEVAL